MVYSEIAQGKIAPQANGPQTSSEVAPSINPIACKLEEISEDFNDGQRNIEVVSSCLLCTGLRLNEMWWRAYQLYITP